MTGTVIALPAEHHPRSNSTSRRTWPTATPGPEPAPARHAVLALPAEVRWVPVARRSATAVLTHWHLPSADLDSAELVIDELAANAAEHGHGDMTIGLSLGAAGVLRISVTDSGSPPRSRHLNDDDPDEHGRGLAIVELLASEVRVHQGSFGRRVTVALRAGLPR